MAVTAKKKVKTPEKMVLVQERRRQHNRSINTRIKNTFKAALNGEGTMEAAFSAIDRAVSKGVVHKNKAARRKSRLAKKLNALAAENK